MLAPSSGLQNRKPFIILALGLLAVSTAAIFIRWAQETDTSSIVVAAGRLSVASLVLTPITLRQYRPQLSALRPVDLGFALLSGLALSIHFAAWITSLEYTSVVNSVVLVTTTPLWVAMMAPFLLGEKLRQYAIIGLVLAFVGGILVAVSGEAGDAPTRHDPLLGNGLAILGAVMAAIYMMIGRNLRARLNVIPYIWLVYSTAAVILVLTVTISGEKVFGLRGEAYLWLLLLGLVPQLIGHSSFNYALGFLPAAYVSIVVLAEPVGSGILAAIFLKEIPGFVQLIGAAFILLGIAIASRDQLPHKKSATPIQKA
jgi:drug/metabolite transporter (DMT)-like permease